MQLSYKGYYTKYPILVYKSVSLTYITVLLIATWAWSMNALHICDSKATESPSTLNVCLSKSHRLQMQV